jgi:hypothetical protein
MEGNSVAKQITEKPSNVEDMTPDATRLLNPRWTKLILYVINGDTGTRHWKVKVNKEIL